MDKMRIAITSSIALMALLLGGCGQPIDAPERFFLAFAEAGTSEIKVRYSSDGISWEDGNFTGGSAGTSFYGVTAAADNLGLTHIVMTDANNAINFVWGLGPNHWDNFAVSEPSFPPASAPSAAYVGENLWLVAFRRSDGAITADIYDSNQKRFIAEVAPQGSLNSEDCNLYANHPAVSNMNGKLLLVWCNNGKLVSAVGEVRGNIPTFSEPHLISLPGDTVFQEGFISSPAIAHDHDKFFVTVVRPRTGGGHGWGVEVQQSNDGVTWTLHSRPSMPVSYGTYLAIGGKSDGVLILAAVREEDNIANALILSNGTWTSLNDTAIQEMFGSTKITAKPFALIGTGKP